MAALANRAEYAIILVSKPAPRSWVFLFVASILPLTPRRRKAFSGLMLSLKVSVLALYATEATVLLSRPERPAAIPTDRELVGV
jgi:hypothetical protein